MIPSDNIPEELRSLRQWIVWCYQTRRDKQGNSRVTKVPFAADGRITSVDFEKHGKHTWATYEEAFIAANSRFDGLGFVLCKHNGLVAFDFDSCVNPETGEVAGWAAEEVLKLNSYTELSPSGTGLHVWTHATLPEGIKRARGEEIHFHVSGRKTYVGLKPSRGTLHYPAIECYGDGRFLCVTGSRVAGFEDAPDFSALAEPRQVNVIDLFTRIDEGCFQTDKPQAPQGSLL